MIKIEATIPYFGKKRALWAAMRYFTEKPLNNVIDVQMKTEEGISNVIFYKRKLIALIGYDFTKDYERLLRESNLDGKLYHKSDILNVYSNSI